MKELVIAIVGGGATAVSLLGALVDGARTCKDCPRLVVYMIEKRRLRGRGLAYEDDLASNLLNTRAGFITPFSDRPGHFFAWLEDNRRIWRHEFAGIDVDAQTFVPRPLFGLYLEYALGQLANEIVRLGGTYVPVTAEATDVERTADGHYVVHTDGSLAIRADEVVLCCGNLQSRELAHLEAHPGFYTSPYPIRRLAHQIDKDAEVAILGARLSAIDVFVGLAESGHRGRLTMFSRSGYLPCVRGTQGRYAPKILTANGIMDHVGRHGTLPLARIVEWIQEEMRLAGETSQIEPLAIAPPDDPIAFLESEIEAAGRPRPWQAVLYSTNGIIDLIWRYLPEEDRKTFLRDHQAAWMAHRVSIPVENARRMLAAAKRGQLVFAPGTTAVTPSAEGGFAVSSCYRGGHRTARFDAVVGAFGSPRDARQLDSPLVQNVLARGLARGHGHGGLDVVPDTNVAIDANGARAEGLSVLGELTAGVHFFTSALEINARHARRVGQGILDAHARRTASIEPLTARA